MKLPVFYTDRMVAESASFSPSAAKPRAVVHSWLELGLPIQVLEPAPATLDELCLAHDRQYVEGVLSGRVANGFGDHSPEVAAALPFTTGAMLSAARHALATGGAVAAPCSGFHHAGYRRGGGFCTFNGLMVTACAVRREGAARRVGIVDCDMHEGDGTDAIRRELGAEPWSPHFTAGASFREVGDAPRFFRQLDRELRQMADCDLLLYQAGADPHVDDPLGGWLRDDELRERDALVFERARELGVPLVWNLAGGYQREPDGSIPKVLAIHSATASEWVRVFEPS